MPREWLVGREEREGANSLVSSHSKPSIVCVCVCVFSKMSCLGKHYNRVILSIIMSVYSAMNRWSFKREH